MTKMAINFQNKIIYRTSQGLKLQITLLYGREGGSTLQIDGWMTCDFTSFSTVFQSYQDDGWMVMNGYVY